MQTTTIRSVSSIRSIGAAIALALTGAAMSQGYFDPRGQFPSPQYRQLEPQVLMYANGARASFFDIFVEAGRIDPPSPGLPAVQSFFDITYDLDFAMPGGSFQPMNGTGSGVAQIQFNSMQGSTQVFDTEMLSMSLTGGGPPVMIRESPTLPSLGRFMRTPEGTGWHVDSFFDVFTEISLDGGQSWVPAVQSVRIVGSPEPGSLLALAGLAALATWKRRRR
jgi:hypothetical protein